MTERKKLNEKQEAFLFWLFHPDVDGQASKAKSLAGYSPETSLTSIMKVLSDEIIEATRLHLAGLGPKAVSSLRDGMYAPQTAGIETSMKAANSILDRTVGKAQEKLEIKAESGVVLLPAKKEE